VARLIDHFDSRTCSRCGGSGTYSFTPMYGSTCFKCGGTPRVPGSGYQLTSAGAKAYAAWIDGNTEEVTGSALVVGDTIFYDGRRRLVKAIEHGAFGSSMSNGVTTEWNLSLKLTGTSYVRVTSSGEIFQRWTSRIALPPEMDPGTDRRAEMKVLIATVHDLQLDP